MISDQHGEKRRGAEADDERVASPPARPGRAAPAGAPARGSKVTLESGGVTQTRIIDAGSGYMCVHEPVAHFGLGSATAVTRVTVQFPSGDTQVIENPAANTVLVVTPAGSEARAKPGMRRPSS